MIKLSQLNLADTIQGCTVCKCFSSCRLALPGILFIPFNQKDLNHSTHTFLLIFLVQSLDRYSYFGENLNAKLQILFSYLLCKKAVINTIYQGPSPWSALKPVPEPAHPVQRFSTEVISGAGMELRLSFPSFAAGVPHADQSFHFTTSNLILV